MSGGIAYVWDPNSSFEANCNNETIELESLVDAQEIDELKTMISDHLRYTGSEVAATLLDNWPQSVKRFVKVMPTDYKRVLAERAAQEELRPTLAASL